MSKELVTSIELRSLVGFAQCDDSDSGLRSWLMSGAFECCPDSNGGFSLTRIRAVDALPYLASDFWRTCFASIESLCVTHGSSISPKSDAWRLIRSYYSTYFAAHAIMRLTNSALVRIEKNEAKFLSQVADQYGNHGAIESKQYIARLTEISGSDAILEFAPNQSTGDGDHQKFWKGFRQYLDLWSTDITHRGEIDATSKILKLSELGAAISGNGQTAGAWLTAKRNELNYRSGGGVWYPYLDFNKKDQLPRQVKASSEIRLDLSPEKTPNMLFDSVSAYISLLCIEATNRIVEKTNSKTTQAKRWKALHKAWISM